MEARIGQVVSAILDEAAEAVDVDLVPDVVAKVPSRVFGQIMGLPIADVGRLHHLSEQVTSSQDPEFEFHGETPEETAAGPAGAMAMYALKFVADRRGLAEPPEDLSTLLLETEFAGAPMDDTTFASFFVQLVTAGNDTTKTMLSSGLLTLLAHPADLAALRRDSGLWPDAIEELLRYDNPLHYFRRTATADTTLAGRPIAAGDKVAMIYTSANRDEAVFDDPGLFDIRRRPNPHLTFGIAEHFCLGAHLARLEARIFFEELLARFPLIEQSGDAIRVRSNLNNAFRSVPMRLVSG
jgi:cytochrome P450